MPNSIYKLGKAKFLKDHSGNIILPRTTTGLVTNAEGITIDELLADFPTPETVHSFNDRVDNVEKDLKAINDLFTAYNENHENSLKEARARISSLEGILRYHSDISMKDMRDILHNTTDVNIRIDEVNNSLSLIDTEIANMRNMNNEQNVHIDNINDRITAIVQKQVELENKLDKKFDEIKSDIKDINDSIGNLEHKLESNVTPISALMTVIELYELFAALHQDQLQPVSEYVIDIYYTLYKAEKVALGEMPEHIQDLIHALILQDELNK